MQAIVHSADIQDRDGGVLLIATLFGLYPSLRKLFADGGYQGPVFEQGVGKFLTQTQVEIIKRSDSAKGFVVLPHRWVVERTFAWLNRCRRLAKDFENRTRNALAFLKLAAAGYRQGHRFHHPGRRVRRRQPGHLHQCRRAGPGGYDRCQVDGRGGAHRTRDGARRSADYPPYLPQAARPKRYAWIAELNG